MPCQYEWERHCVVKRFSGYVSAEDFLSSVETVAADPRFDDLRLIINDFSQIQGHSIDADAYLMVAARRIGAVQTNPNFHVAFIVRPADALELQAVFSSGRQGLPFDPRVVTTEAQARACIAGPPHLGNPYTRF